ncbi:MAG: hypothetical protein H6719_13075 [Sandaracinaceae bacterium]|nr:hypothetical protein [Sandaracinaceae bacterium]
MHRIRLSLTLLATAALLAACANEMPFDPMDPTLDGARLVIVGSPAVTLRYGEMADLPVRYERADGSVIENAPIDYAIVGTPNGSMLAALQTVTDVAGNASVGLTSGSADAMFDVEVTPPVGDSVVFSVAVSDSDLGSITVTMTYAGSRTLSRFDAFLFDGASCAGMDPNALPTALRSAPSVSSITAMPAFAGVPVGSSYAVAVVARSATNISAFGCRDMISVVARQDTPVNITLMELDIPPDFTGVWDLDNRLDFGGALPPSVETFLNVLDELTDDSALSGDFGPGGDSDGDGVWPEYGQDPGAFVVDLVMRQTCHWTCATGEDYSTCSSTDHRLGDLRSLYVQDFTSWDGAQSRFFGGCGGWTFIHEDIQTRINDLAPDFVTDWLMLAGDLSRAITQAHILSVLTINAPAAGSEFDLPMSHELVSMVVPIHNPLSDPPGMVSEYTFALADAGFTSLEVTDITRVTGTTLSIPSHQFNLNWGRLTLYIYREIILREVFGVGSTGELLGTWINCMNVGQSLRDSLDGYIGAGSGPNAMALAGYCDAALTAAGDALEGAIGDALDSEGTLTLMGTADGMDIDMETGRVGSLVNGMWSGSFGEDTMTMTIDGTFTGERRAP